MLVGDLAIRKEQAHLIDNICDDVPDGAGYPGSVAAHHVPAVTLRRQPAVREAQLTSQVQQ